MASCPVMHSETQLIQGEHAEETSTSGASGVTDSTPSARISTVALAAYRAQEIASSALIILRFMGNVFTWMTDAAYSAAELIGIAALNDGQKTVEKGADLLEFITAGVVTVIKKTTGIHLSFIDEAVDIAALTVIGCCEFAKILVGIPQNHGLMQLIANRDNFMDILDINLESDIWNYVMTEYSGDSDIFTFCFAKEYPGFIDYSVTAKPHVLVNYTRDDLVVSVKIGTASKVLGFDPLKSKGLVKYDGHQDISTVLFVDAVDSSLTWEDTQIEAITLGLDTDKKIVGLQVKEAAARVAETISEEDVEFYVNREIAEIKES